MTRFKWTAICAMQAALLAVSSLAAAANATEQADVFKGTIGQAAVVMSLDASDAQGVYFYEKYKHDINVRGRVKDHAYVLKEGVYDELDNGNRILLHRDGTHLTGTYTTAKGKALSVALTLVPPGSVPEPRPELNLEADEGDRLNAGGDYHRLRLTGMQLLPQKPQTVGGRYTIQWYLEPHSGERLFRLVKGWPQPVMDTINVKLEASQFLAAAADLACAGDGATPTDIRLELVNDRFLSFQGASSWSCEGAAHPGAGVAGTTFDTRTGKQLTLEDLWWLGKGQKPKHDSDAFYDYRREVFGPAVVHLLTQRHPQDMREPANSDDCDYGDPGVWEIVQYWLTDKGLQLQPSFGHAQQDCEGVDWAVIPYKVLKKANPALFEGTP